MKKLFWFFVLVWSACLILFHQSYAQLRQPETIRVLAVRVEFEEDQLNTTTGTGKFDLSDPSGPYQVDPPPHNRLYFEDHLTFLNNYFHKVSHGKLLVEGEVFPSGVDEAYQLDFPMSHYNPNTTPEANSNGLAMLFRDAVLKADEDPDINFSEFQSIVVFHAGVGKDIDLGFDETPQDIPSLFITRNFLTEYLGQSSITVDNGVEIDQGMILPETESQEGLELGLNGMLVSNFGSQLGLLDLFSPETRRTGIGRFGLMDAGLFNGDGLLPALPCAWTRIDAGWETPVDIHYGMNDEFSIYHTLSSQPDRVFRLAINSSEYFLVENRHAGEKNLDSLRFEMSENQQDAPTIKEVLLTHFADEVAFSERGVLIDVKNPDIGLPGTGVLIWHVDEKVIEANRAANRINADPEHRGVDLEEADGSQDIGQEFDFLSAGSGSESGWLLDMWYPDNDAPLFENKFSPETVPNSRSYYNRANSHITLSDFTGPDSTVTFRVNFNIFQQNFPITVDPQQFGTISSVKAVRLQPGETQTIVMTTLSGKLLAVDQSGKSNWGSDSLLIEDFGEPVQEPPVFFTMPVENGSGDPAMFVITRSGKAAGYVFRPNFTIDSLTVFQSQTPASTYPLAHTLDDNTVDIYWGSEDGSVYQMEIAAGDISITTLFDFDEAVEYIHLNSQNQILTVTETGKIYRDGELVGSMAQPVSPPTGAAAVLAFTDGQLYSVENDISGALDNAIYRFDSPLISFPVSAPGDNESVYFIAGKNYLYGFNYNFTLYDRFPLPIYTPARTGNLKLTPLLANFICKDMSEKTGIILADPAGLIHGFDLDGNLLANFPLAAGDSLSCSPALLDIDGDGDVELAAASVAGDFYVWDLPAQYEDYFWNQIYYDPMNSNRVPDQNFGSPIQSKVDLAESNLLPGKRAYNWPNPNTENYTFIRYFLTEPADIWIKIYDLAGDLVDEFPGPSEPFTDNEVRWDLTGVQSGVYLARIKAENSSRKESRIVKIAVVK